MRLLLKERFFSLFDMDNFDIYDETGRKAYVVEGQFSLTHHLRIYDGSNRFLGAVRQRFLTLLPKFDLYVGEQMVGSIHKELTLFSPRYHIDFNGWRIEGNWLEWDYHILDDRDREIARISKELLNWTDTYSIDIHDPQNALCVLMVVLAIDADKCSRPD